MNSHVPTAAENLIEAIQLLHELFKTDAEIAKKLDIGLDEVEFILKHGKVPERQLAWSWDAVEEQS